MTKYDMVTHKERGLVFMGQSHPVSGKIPRGRRIWRKKRQRRQVVIGRSQSGRPTHSAGRRRGHGGARIENVIGRGDENIGGSFKSRNVLECGLLYIETHLHTRAHVYSVNKSVHLSRLSLP